MQTQTLLGKEIPMIEYAEPVALYNALAGYWYLYVKHYWKSID